MLKPTKNGELRIFWPSYSTFQISNNKGADQTVHRAGWSTPLLFASNKVRVSRLEAYMMLKPRLPGLRLATRLPNMCIIDGETPRLTIIHQDDEMREDLLR